MNNFKSGDIFKAQKLIKLLEECELKDLRINGKKLSLSDIDKWEFYFSTHHSSQKSLKWKDMYIDMK